MAKKKKYDYILDEEGRKIKKCEIKVDKETLKSLEKVIFDKFAVCTHRKYESEKRPNSSDKLHIRNYSERFIERREVYRDGPIEDFYEFEYDYYEDPEIVNVIEYLLKGGSPVNALNYIKKIEDNLLSNRKKSNEGFNSFLNSTLETLTSIHEKQKENQISSKDSLELKRIAEGFDKFKDFTKENERTREECNYIDLVRNCLKLTIVDSLDIEVFNQIDDFFGYENISYEVSLDLVDDVKKVLTRGNKK